MQQKIGVFQFLQCGAEGIHQMMGELCNEAHGVGENHVQIVGYLQLAGCGIQGVKQPVVGGNSRTGQPVQQRGLSRVGIAHNGNHRYRIFHSPFPLDGTHLAHLFQLRLQPVDPLADVTAVGFQLCFTGATGADAAALTAQAQTHAGQPGQQVLVLGKLYLQSALSGFGPLGKNIQNQRAAIQNRHADDLFQRPDIAGRKLVIEYHHGGLCELHQHFHFLRLSLSDEAVRIGGVPVLQNFARAEAARGFQKRFQLFQRFVRGRLFLRKAIGIEANQHRPLLHSIFQIHFHRSIILRFDYYTTSSPVQEVIWSKKHKKTAPRFP